MKSVKVGRVPGGMAFAVGLLALLALAQAQYPDFVFLNIVGAGPPAAGGAEESSITPGRRHRAKPSS